MHVRSVHKEIRPINTTHVALEPSPQQIDPVLDNLAPFDGTKLKISKKTVSPTAAIDEFLSIYAVGFRDPKYIRDERDYKLAAVDRYRAQLSLDEIRSLLKKKDFEELRSRAGRVAGPPLNLLSPYELMALREALTDDTANRRFFEALAAVVLDGEPCEESFSELCRAVNHLPAEEGRARVATWPVATLLPHLALPDRFMFLKPTPTKACAERLGWEISYRSEPNWLTYSRVMTLAAWMRDELLVPVGVRDLIDVQSFMWLIAEELSVHNG